MVKDLDLAQAAAAATGTATPLGALAATLYHEVAEAGEAGRDFSVAYQWLSRQPRRSG
jgi:3-hydroxyisobutyrate dehydrogenase